MSFEQLMNNFSNPGLVQWIGIRPAKKAELISVCSVLLDPEFGVEGDHYAGRSGKRQVTLMQAEHLPVIASMMQREIIKPEHLRRNIVIQGINLLALKNKTFQVGAATLEFTGLCHPCTRMESTLGKGGYNAMRGHGGITARITQPGMISIGSECKVKS